MSEMDPGVRHLGPMMHWHERPLSPHQFQSRFRLLRKVPRVLLTPDAFKRIQLYVKLAPLEIGWLGTAAITDSGDYLIDQVFLLKQSVGAAHTILSVEGLTELYNELRSQGKRDDLKRLFFWGHSHVHMDTEPSGQDNSTMEDLGKQGNRWFLRGIFNKNGKAQFSIYMYESGISIFDAPWGVWDPETGKEVALPESKPAVSPYSTRPLGLDESKVIDLPAILQADENLIAAVKAEFKAKVTEDMWGGPGSYAGGLGYGGYAGYGYGRMYGHSPLYGGARAAAVEQEANAVDDQPHASEETGTEVQVEKVPFTRRMYEKLPVRLRSWLSSLFYFGQK